MTKQEALSLMQQNLKNQNLIKHSLAVSACMEGLAKYFKEDEEKWAITGLLHDIDYEETKDDMKNHSKLGYEMLKNIGFDEDICKAVLTHNDIHKVPPQDLMAKALYCVDPLTGLIVASTLVLPDKKIESLNTQNILNRFKEKSFAKGANRETILKCEEFLNISLEDFISICLNSMQNISSDLGL